jgi:magnesium-transporting ATPase (P-type)
MLTGDKLETAENIGYSCRLIQADFKTMFIRADDNLHKKYAEYRAAIEQYKAQGLRKTLLIEGNAISKLPKF